MHNIRTHTNLNDLLRQHISPKWEFTNLVISIEDNGDFRVSILDGTHYASAPMFIEALYQLAPNCYCDTIDILSPNG